MTKRVYVCEENECVGPFASDEDAEYFIELIELHSGNREGIEKVEIDEEVGVCLSRILWTETSPQ